MLVENCDTPEPRVLPASLEVYELLCVPVLAVDAGFNITYINEKACEMTGYSKEEVREKKLFDIATPGEFKKKLMRLFKGHAFDRDFTMRGSLLTRNGRIRSVEWQCRVVFDGILRSGAVITFTDLTHAETVLDMARIMTGSDSIECLAYGFMDLLSDPLNLKLARVSLNVEDRQTQAFFRAYPHGAVHKKPRQALHDSSDSSARAETFSFTLQAEGRSIGAIELTPYSGSYLTVEDESYVRRLCETFSSGVARLVPSPSIACLSVAAEKSSMPAPRSESSGMHANPLESQKMSSLLMDLLPHGVIVCGPDGLVTTVNESIVRMLGLSRGEMEGRDIQEVMRMLAPERENGVAMGVRNMAICRALKTGSPAMNVRSFVKVNGSRRELNVSAMPIGGAGEVAGCLAAVRDVTVIGSIIRMGQMALSIASASDLVEESLDLVMNAMNLRMVSLYLWDGRALMLKVQRGEQHGMPVPECRDVPDHQNPTLQSRVFLRGKPLLIKDYRRCASVRLFDPLARKRPIRSMAGVPLRSDSDVIGVIVAATGEGHPMDETELAELSALCGQMAASVRQAYPHSGHC